MIQDRFGREIKAGTLITYPRRSGSCMWVQDSCVDCVDGDTIYVVGIGEFYTLDRGYFFKLHRYPLKADLSRVTVVNYKGSEYLADMWETHKRVNEARAKYRAERLNLAVV